MISDFRRDVYEICALLRYYSALSGSSVPTFRENLSIISQKSVDLNFKNICQRRQVSSFDYFEQNVARIMTGGRKVKLLWESGKHFLMRQFIMCSHLLIFWSK